MGKLWERSGTVERDANDDRADGALAYFFSGGTTTPLAVYQDAGETTPHTHPVVASSTGRWPAVFIPFVATYDVQVKTAGGTTLYYYTDIPNPDPVEEAEDSVDENALLQTGDFLFTPKSGTRAGFVRANGRTIGSAASGASERANDDTEDLYTFLWDNFADGILAVTSGRGASAAADFAANKPIAVFDGRSAVLRGLDDMGNSAAALLALATFTNGNATTGGSVAGANSHTLVTDETPAHTHSVTGTTSSDGAHTHTGTTASDGAHTHTGTTAATSHVHTFGNNFGAANFTVGGDSGTPTPGLRSDVGGSPKVIDTESAHTHNFTTASSGAHTHTFTTASNGAHTHTVTGTAASVGGDDAHNNVSKSILCNILIKL